MKEYSEISELVGQTFEVVSDLSDELHFYKSDRGLSYRFCHYQVCCEEVGIEDINGDLSDLENTPILMAEESTLTPPYPEIESATWTFYKFATLKGFVTVRWYGESNGYYSESVDFERV